MRRSFGIAFFLVLGIGLTGPLATASAASAGFEYDAEALVYRAALGEKNDVTVSRQGDRVVIHDAGAQVVPGTDCAAVDASTVSCLSRQATIIRLGDGDDQGTTSGQLGDFAGEVEIDGEAGADTIRGTADANSMSGGTGEDVLIAGPGTRSVGAVVITSVGSPTKMPTISADHDQISCSEPFGEAPSSLRHVSVDELDTVTGPCGQISHYTPDAVVSRGSAAADLLNGSYFPTRLYGEGGDDRLFGTGTKGNRMSGGPGDDEIESGGLLLGGEGDDRLTGLIANDLTVREDGGPGRDQLLGRYGKDRLVGGPGRDRITGLAGDDFIRARDGERDSIHCGDGHDDRVEADRIDKIAADCERVSRR